MEQLRKVRDNKPDYTFRVPSAERLIEVVRAATRDQVPDDPRFASVFNRAEALIALVNGASRDPAYSLWIPIGLHVFRTKDTMMGIDTLSILKAELEAQGDQWPPVATGLFPSVDRAAELIDAYRAQVGRFGFGW
jgi:hypothetical protein